MCKKLMNQITFILSAISYLKDTVDYQNEIKI